VPMVAAALGQVLAVLTVVVLSPLLHGTIATLKAKVQARQGPSPCQPYYDLAKLLHKRRIRGPHASAVSRAAPYLAFAAPVAFAVLIPVLTAFPLSWAFMADMVGSGFVLGVGGFMVNLAAMDNGSPYGGLGASRSRLVSALAEPTFIVVFFAVAFVSSATVPFVVNRALFTTTPIVAPSHALLAAAFFLVVLAEAGRIPVDNPATQQELSMIEASRLFEFSGPDLALLQWGSWMKLFVVLVVWLNVLVAPLGLATTLAPSSLAIAVVTLAAKMLGAAALIAGLESALAKIRILRVPEFLGASFVLAVLALVVFSLGQ
jgi:formate hydrogenlyase subunit 4